ncbi:hypothetical protein [Nannocystis punicea]|uniref:Uncharacterized protein n=1 Tax=Nannocystis punicea TaxID=2995304 RepID=A0ABY7H899_9BACT|nr:hypothetical protein [Nannocystis poenicansa]WAS95312.1 hypothetical protein O0S08_04060 [Nannocystis poenicansa]
MIKRLHYFLMIGVLVACGSEPSGETDTDAGTGTDTVAGTDSDSGTDALTPEEAEICACLDDGSCGAELCPSVGNSCPEEGCSPEESLVDEGLECALTALRDRTPGKIGWFDSSFGGQFSDRTAVYIRADATAVVERSGDQDLESSRGPHTLHPLKEPEYYDGCLAMTAAQDRLNCLEDGLGEETAVCKPYMSVEGGGI